MSKFNKVQAVVWYGGWAIGLTILAIAGSDADKTKWVFIPMLSFIALFGLPAWWLVSSADASARERRDFVDNLMTKDKK